MKSRRLDWMVMIVKRLIDAVYYWESGRFGVCNAICSLINPPLWAQQLFRYRPELFDSEYLFNRSGNKMASVFVENIYESAQGEHMQATRALAYHLISKYGDKWRRLFDIYLSDEQSLFDNINIIKTVDGDLVDTSTGSDVKEMTNNLTDTSSSNGATTYDLATSKEDSATDSISRSGGYTDTTSRQDSYTTTKTGSAITTEGGTTGDSTLESGTRTSRVAHTGTVSDVGSSLESNYGFGFNTTGETGNRTGRTGGELNNTKTYNNTDTTTDTPSITVAKTISHGKTLTDTFNNLADTTSGTNGGTTQRLYNNYSEAESHSLTGETTKEGTETKVLSGTVYHTGTVRTTLTVTSNKTKNNEVTTNQKGFNNNKTILDNISSIIVEPKALALVDMLYEDIDEVLVIPCYCFSCNNTAIDSWYYPWIPYPGDAV